MEQYLNNPGQSNVQLDGNAIVHGAVKALTTQSKVPRRLQRNHFHVRKLHPLENRYHHHSCHGRCCKSANLEPYGEA
jgi:hypothetical protein